MVRVVGTGALSSPAIRLHDQNPHSYCMISHVTLRLVGKPSALPTQPPMSLNTPEVTLEDVTHLVQKPLSICQVTSSVLGLAFGALYHLALSHPNANR